MTTDYQTYVKTTTAAGERFTHDTRDHQMTILHDDGLYRHLRFRRPDSGMYWFDLNTWPGHLTITGDFGTGYTFARLNDMFEFFRGKGINPQYWAEKITSGGDGVKAYSMETFVQLVNEQVANAVDWNPRFAESTDDQPSLPEAVKRALSDDYNHEYEEGAREFLRDFEYRADGEDPWQFVGTWEWDLTDWGWSYLWACHAIVWGIGQYDAAKASVGVAAS